MVRVNVELWMWMGKELGEDFDSPSAMRSVMETEVEQGTTGRKLFEDLAARYRPIEQKVFNAGSFDPYVVLTLNGRSIAASQLCDRVLEDGDKITVMPVYFGG